MMKKITLLVTACALAACVTGCGCQKQEAPAGPNLVEKTETTAATVEAVETTEAPETTEAVETTEQVVPTTEDLWELAPSEDNRPPIEVTIPDETRPYTDYEQYMDMTGEEQEAFFKSFDNDQAFFDWFNQAKTDYEKAHPPVIIDGSTNIEFKP